METIIENLGYEKIRCIKDIEGLKRDLDHERKVIESSEERINRIETTIVKLQNFIDDYDRAIEALRSVI